MRYLLILLIVFLNILKYRCDQPSCRTNCSKNATIDDECWHQALVYRSSELIEQLFSFSSLSVHVDAYRQHHSSEFNDTIKFVDKFLDNHLLNESIDANLNMNLFNQTKSILLDFCRNLILTPVDRVDKFPSLTCSTYTCAVDILNYLVLFIISALIAGSILIICVVQSFQTRRKSNSLVTVQQSGPLINSLSTTHTSVNT